VSADNWAVCPRCSTERSAALVAERARVAAAYGTVPVEEFDAMRAALTEREFTDPEQTYSGKCRACGLEFKHNSEHPVPLDADR
jgi:hypothetical protein